MEQLLEFIEYNQYNLPVFLVGIGVVLVVMWLAVVAWIIRDITTRTKNLPAIILSPLLVLLGWLPGLVIYLLLRPAYTLEESRHMNLIYTSVLDKDVMACAKCHNLVRADHKFCPHCGKQLQAVCPECKVLVNPKWNFCANCHAALRKPSLKSRMRTKARSGLLSAARGYAGFVGAVDRRLRAVGGKVRSFRMGLPRVKYMPETTATSVEKVVNGRQRKRSKKRRQRGRKRP